MALRLFEHPRSGVWWVDLRAHGFGRHSTGETDETEATLAAAAKLVELRSRAPDALPSSATIAALQTAYAASCPRTAQGKGDRQRTAALVAYLGKGALARSVSVPAITAWARHLSDNLAPATVVRYRASVSAMFRWARQLGHVEHNPVPGSWCPRVGSMKKRAALTLDEVRATLDAVKGTPLHAAYTLAFYAGLRLSEIVRARWEDVDLERGTIYVRGSKTAGSEATLPLHPKLAAWAQGAYNDACKTFRNPRASTIVSTGAGLPYHPQSLGKLRQSLNLPGFHLARHTLATILVAEGVDIFHVSELLRHTSVRTTQAYYAWASPSRRGDELAKFDG